MIRGNLHFAHCRIKFACDNIAYGVKKCDNARAWIGLICSQAIFGSHNIDGLGLPLEIVKLSPEVSYFPTTTSWGTLKSIYG